MEFREVVRRRKMVRSFTAEPVAADVVERILDVARRAPTAGHSQGVEFVVITEETTRNAIAKPSDELFAQSGHHNFVAQAPVHIAICVSPEIYRSRYREPDKMQAVSDVPDDDLWAIPYWYTDAGAALMLLLLAAVNEGVAAAFAGAGRAGDAGHSRRLCLDRYRPARSRGRGRPAVRRRQRGFSAPAGLSRRGPQ
ncbi:nitroreductase family protein [Kibdelosporangium philippinense]|uniref:Nitroreductase family protein n=1 Tax=Kibdelosporangium philippinense TaxID=211113 RepID=A0ABS8ZRA1_9PSEU|nr:nitroreductase family protein [Kibdelosporangium philippinense]MCE7010279.1 nitroreductase family protein [Kibdelosporangium philippinense]